MSHANLCQPCAQKRQGIVKRIGQYAKGFRCDACRRLTKTATCHSVAHMQDEDVVTYDDLIDMHDACIY